jgi:hypothetical protein
MGYIFNSPSNEVKESFLLLVDTLSKGMNNLNHEYLSICHPFSSQTSLPLQHLSTSIMANIISSSKGKSGNDEQLALFAKTLTVLLSTTLLAILQSIEVQAKKKKRTKRSLSKLI